MLLLLLLWSVAPGARADARGDHYAGLQLAPSVHGGIAHRSMFGGAGAELSLGKWLLVELQLTGLSRPFDRPDLPGAVQTSLGLYSRAGGGTHTFVYGAGVSYLDRYECDRYCSVFAAIAGPEEQRSARDLWSADVGLGYEARLASRFFLRGMTRVQIPLHVSDFTTNDYGEGETSLGPDRHGLFFVLRLSVYLTVGYAFTL